MKENNFEYVDLGLPSGTKWAKCNVGAEHEEDAGLYFQFGDTEGFSEREKEASILLHFMKKEYAQNLNNLYSIYGIYGKPYSNIDTYYKSILDMEDDAAHVNMGGKWRMPTKEDMIELLTYTDVYMVKSDGTEVKGDVGNVKDVYYDFSINFNNSNDQIFFKGIKFCKRNSKNVYIFIPASGMYTDGVILTKPINVSLWTSSVGYVMKSIIRQCTVGHDIQSENDGYHIRGVFK